MAGKLSVCMIVRDEADVLPRCLASVAGLADEIVALDTGSTDGTPELLRQAGAKVIEAPWQDDFGQARTAAMREATGDWVLFIDADEALDEATRHHLKLLLVDVDSPVSFEVPILSYLEDDDAGETTLSWMPRLCNQPGEHFWLGRIHEQLIGSAPVRLDESIILLRHWGYQPARVAAKGKSARNLAILTAEAAATDSLRTAIYQASAATNAAEALEHARNAIANVDDQTSPAVAAVVAVMYLDAIQRVGQPQTMLDEADALLARIPSLDSETQVWKLRGDAHLALGAHEAAEAAYATAWSRAKGDRVLQYFHTEMVPVNAAVAYAGALMARRELAGARQVLEDALTMPRLSRKTLSRLQAALSATMAGSSSGAAALSMAQSAVAVLPDLRTAIANSFIDQDQPILALRLMAPILDPLVLQDRVTTMAASLMGDERSVELLQWFLDDYGDNGPTRINMGLHWLALNEPDNARAAIASGLGVDPTDVAVELRLAFFDQVLGRLEAAEARLAATVQSAGEANAEGWLAETLMQWGNLAFQTSQWEKAADLFESLLQLRPQDPYAHYAKAAALYGLGDLINARSGMERALLIDPTFAPAHQGLASLLAAQAGGT